MPSWGGGAGDGLGRLLRKAQGRDEIPVLPGLAPITPMCSTGLLSSWQAPPALASLGLTLNPACWTIFDLFLFPRHVGMVDRMYGSVYRASGSGWCQTVPRHEPVQLLDLVIT